MTISMYQKYLLLEQIKKRLEAVGGKAEDIGFGYANWEAHPIESLEDKTYSFMHHATLTVTGFWEPEEREAFADKWLLAYPDTELVRREGNIYLRGETWAGLRWLVSVGAGVCERVQVGTKKKFTIDPEFLVDAPMIEVEEPVYEVRCVDPLRDLVAEPERELVSA